MCRFIVYWKGQNIEAIPPAKVCAVHRDVIIKQIKPHIPKGAALVSEKTNDGECALSMQGGCGDK